MTAQKSWRRRVTSVFATATAGLLAVSGAVLAPTAAYAAEEAAPVKGTVADATLDWGVKASFRNYLYNFPAFDGRATLLGTTEQAEPKGTYQWIGGSGVGTTDGSELDISYGEGNGVHFQSHPMTVDGQDVFALDITFTNPRIVATSASTGELRMDVEGYEFAGMTEVGDPYSIDDALIATLDLPTPSVAGNTLTWTAAPATLTEEGSIAFGGFYDAGEALDPLTFSGVVTPAVATTTTLTADSTNGFAGGSVDVTATVTPVAQGAFQFSNDGVAVGEPVAAAEGVATLSIPGLAAGENNITAAFVPANEYAHSSSTSEPVVVDAVAPALSVELVGEGEARDPYSNQPVAAGDKLVVKGTGYDPKSNIGGRGVPIPNTLPQGVYVVFGQFADNWRPSEDAPSSNRAVGAQGWVLTEDTVDQVPPNFQGAVRAQWVELAADGSFEWEATLANPSTVVADGNFGIYTYGAGGVKNAFQEKAVPVNYTTVTSAVELAVAPEAAEVGDEIELTAKITPATATGEVQFTYGASVPLGEPVDVVDGEATLVVTDLPVGEHEIKANFVSDEPTEVSSNSSSVRKVSISVKPTTTTLTAPATSTYGDEVTFSALVAPLAAAGEVQFFNGESEIGTAVPVLLGQAELTTSALPAGEHSITAKFTPANENFGASESNAHVLTVAAQATSTTLVVDPDEVAFGGTATLTASVTPATEGTVTFKNGSNPIGEAVAVAEGEASIEAALPAGNNVITAEFTPASANYLGSTSNSAAVNVTPGVTALVLEASAASVREFDEFALTATVSPAVDGDVTFTRTDEDGSEELETVDVVNGMATLTTVEIVVGEPSFGASFTPANAAEYQASTADDVVVTVTERDPELIINGEGSATVTFGEDVEIVAGPFNENVTHVRAVVNSDPIDLGVFAVTDRWAAFQLDWSLFPEGFSGAHTLSVTPVNPDGSAIEGAQSISAALTVEAASSGGSGAGGSAAGDAAASGVAGAKGLATTGANGMEGMIALGALALLIGAASILVARRRAGAQQ